MFKIFIQGVLKYYEMKFKKIKIKQYIISPGLTLCRTYGKNANGGVHFICPNI